MRNPDGEIVGEDLIFRPLLSVRKGDGI